MKDENKENSISETEIKELLSVFLNSVDVRDYYKELFTNNVEILELIFDNYFHKIEGFTCSHDKSSYTVNKILKSLSTKEVYSLQETYDKAYDDNFNLKVNPDFFIAAYSIAGKIVEVVE